MYPRQWSLGSAVATGGSNWLVGALVQATAGTTALGAFAIVTGPLTVSLAIQRGIASQTLLSGGYWREVPGWVTTFVAITATSAAVMALLCVLFHTPWWSWLLVVVVPIVHIEDAYRFQQFGRGYPANAAIADFVWLIVQLSSLAAFALLGMKLSPGLAVGTWLIGGAASLVLVGSLSHGKTPGTVTPQEIANVWHLTLETFGVVALAQVSIYAVAVFSSMERVGQFRLAQLAVTPAALVSSALLPILLPKIQLRARGGRIVSHASILIALAGGACCAAYVVMPEDARALVKLPFQPAVLATMVLLIAGMTLSIFVAARMTLVRISRPARYWIRGRFLAATTEPGVSVAAGLILGAPGIALGSVVHQLVVLASLRLPKSKIGRSISSDTYL
jgi:hypothetical protein